MHSKDPFWIKNTSRDKHDTRDGHTITGAHSDESGDEISYNPSDQQTIVTHLKYTGVRARTGTHRC